MEMPKNARIYVAGHRGLVGSAIYLKLRAEGYTTVITRTRDELDLLDQAAVTSLFQYLRPEYVFLAAAKVGGIGANNALPGEFIFENLQIQNNVIVNAAMFDVKKLLFLGSSCIYPKLSPQPIKEESLLTGPLEPTNQWYAIAKIAGIKLCQAYRLQYGVNFISAMPTNIYGPGDNYDEAGSHVLPALIRRFHEAKVSQAPKVVCWGTGAPLREMLYVDDLASACLLLMDQYNSINPINVGSGEEVSIRTMAVLVAKIVGYQGVIEWDSSKPDGTMRKILDSSKIRALGWKPAVVLEAGIRRAYASFLMNRFS